MAQSTKKKTVKELNVDVINLAKEFKQFKDVLEGITNLGTVKNLDTKIIAIEKKNKLGGSHAHFNKTY